MLVCAFSCHHSRTEDTGEARKGSMEGKGVPMYDRHRHRDNQTDKHTCNQRVCTRHCGGEQGYQLQTRAHVPNRQTARCTVCPRIGTRSSVVYDAKVGTRTVCSSAAEERLRANAAEVSSSVKGGCVLCMLSFTLLDVVNT